MDEQFGNSCGIAPQLALNSVLRDDTKVRHRIRHVLCLHSRVVPKDTTTLQREIRKSYWAYIEYIIDYTADINNDRQTKQNKFWSYIKHLRKYSTGVSRLRSQGETFSDAACKAKLLKAKLYKKISSDIHPLQLIKLHHFKLARFKSI